ncbi:MULTISPECIES: hypothetical protein [Ralstonia]|jgi:hypothetical protein|uniref:Lipoprotein n=1 Tax=Ralstonia pickettii OR214 TaxID=1264675 RepID=R0EBX8_RALPI|nr:MULTISPECIES: hypothetical protein [Ralstonia]ENZ79594.1 hypothetical protein OR214_00010 [Ralstonia pickettii OR214]MBL4778428.1 hypothetical protein [Ralstonia sp.]MCM3582129.1 hypothetical protein [Ralstonia pickettii]
MSQVRRLIDLMACVTTFALLSACSPSPEQVAKEVKTMFQNRLSSEAGMADLHATVSTVTLIRDQGNRYGGVATVNVDGKAHEVPIKVLADGKSVMYEADSASMGFLLEAQMKKLFPVQKPAQAATAPSHDDAVPDDVAHLIAQEDLLNQACRGGSGDSPTTASSCDARDATYKAIRARGWCWGHKDDTGADRRWVKCAPGDA